MSLFRQLSASLQTRTEQARHRAFLNAAMAGAALAATADGRVSFARRCVVDQVLDGVAPLKVFPAETAVAAFAGFADDILARPERGRTRAVEAISAVASEPDAARVVLRIAEAVARAEGKLTAHGAVRLEDVSRALGLGAAELRPGDMARPAPSCCIAIGNQKGGTGKSTTAMHLAIGLAGAGHAVGCIDLDGRQGTLTHYLENRLTYARRARRDLAMPRTARVRASEARDRDVAERDDSTQLGEALASLADCDFVIIDSPGSDGFLARLGLAQADILVTPLNDSFLDIDVLAEIDVENRRVVAPSAYATTVMRHNESRLASGRPPLDWIVMRNRMAQLDTRNSRDVARLLAQLSERMGFRLHPGLSERVVFRDLFYDGLTILDFAAEADEGRIDTSRRNAREEMMQLVEAVRGLRRASAAVA
jgi:chromosome partitioning protein